MTKRVSNKEINKYVFGPKRGWSSDVYMTYRRTKPKRQSKKERLKLRRMAKEMSDDFLARGEPC